MRKLKKITEAKNIGIKNGVSWMTPFYEYQKIPAECEISQKFTYKTRKKIRNSREQKLLYSAKSFKKDFF